MGKLGLRLLIILGLAALAAGCSDDDVLTGPDDKTPSVANVTIESNPYNNLSLLADFKVANADSVRLQYGPAGGLWRATPRRAVTGATMRLAALGLLPETTYEFTVVATRGLDEARSTPVLGTSGALPEFLANEVTIEITGTPPAGFIATNVLSGADNRYAYIFDETGRIVWYRHFDFLTGFSQQLPNGNFGAYVGLSQGFQPTYGYYAEITPAGEEVRRHQAVAPLYTDGHELLLTPRGGDYAAHLFSYSLHEVDMTGVGGLPDALIGGHQILRFSPSGAIEFSWNAWDHFSLADWIELPDARRQSANADFDHPNALAIDHDGNYVASFRDLAEVTKINSRTGSLVWRLGGAKNQFTFVNDPLGGFNGQHSVRILDNGNVLLYDNGLRHEPPESRAVEYAVDPVQMTATLVWEYRHSPATYTPYTGGAERRLNGNTVVQFAGVGLVVEVDPGGQVVWTGQVRVSGNATGLYRLNPMSSLYEYRRP